MRKTRTALAATATAAVLLTVGLVAASSGTATAATTIKIKPVVAPTPNTAYSPQVATYNFAVAVSGTPAIWAQVRARDWHGSTPLTAALAHRIEPLFLPAWRAPGRWSLYGGDADGYVAAEMGPISVPVRTRKIGPLSGGAPGCKPTSASTSTCHTSPRRRSVPRATDGGSSGPSTWARTLHTQRACGG